jgi:integrase
MGVKLKKYKGKWYLFIDYSGKRKAKCLGTDRKLAESIKRQVEAKLVLGDLGVFGTEEQKLPTFDEYANSWMKDYVRIECKTSTADGYEGVLRQYLRPRFAPNRLDHVTRDQIKSMINELVAKNLARNTIRNALCVIRGMFNQAIESGLLKSNPAARLGRFTRTARNAAEKGVSLTAEEVQSFLDAANEICPEYYPLFLTAFRAGLRRGELVALQMGDLNFGKDADDLNRYIFVQHNYVHREHTSTKSKKARRVDMSKDLRRALIDLRDKRLFEAFMKGINDISDELVFPSPDGGILDPDNLYHRYFLPVLAKAGIRKIRLHDLRHTFGSLLIQAGASIVYVKEQMGHSSIQVTVDTYGHLIPGANTSFVDQLDMVREEKVATTPQQSATQTQPALEEETKIPVEVVDLIGGGGWTRTSDLRIMRPSL